jgi:hypothetical protein
MKSIGMEATGNAPTTQPAVAINVGPKISSGFDPVIIGR